MQKVNKIIINQFNKDNIGTLKTPWYSDIPNKAIQKINTNLKTSVVYHTHFKDYKKITKIIKIFIYNKKIS
ncbi:hypothetical protein M1771_06835 [Spiroplasma citri]|uniref:Uncharacterized protein n=1 Tax=Spiroplasma citri TaxID=2133 RepID=A0AAX3SWX3_SPICI|nr:hypothetical protein [Spiroplasma citri]WFG95825.1 hypothetical protein M0C40_06900 [Spiroplasma citri]WFG99707.1 hypothetical protein M1771_06835 [Spiroplasma citri]